MAAEFGADALVEVIYEEVYAAAVVDAVSTMIDPPGREPDSAALTLHQWYVSLSDYSRSMVSRALTEAADSAVFGLLAILDGSRSISDTTRRELRLTLVEEGRELILAPGGPDGDLHDIFRAIVGERTDDE